VVGKEVERGTDPESVVHGSVLVEFNHVELGYGAGAVAANRSQ
jgi:hypothetical protein